MQEHHASLIVQHLQTLRDSNREQAKELKRIADALEALVAAKL